MSDPRDWSNAAMDKSTRPRVQDFSLDWTPAEWDNLRHLALRLTGLLEHTPVAQRDRLWRVKLNLVLQSLNCFNEES